MNAKKNIARNSTAIGHGAYIYAGEIKRLPQSPKQCARKVPPLGGIIIATALMLGAWGLFLYWVFGR